MNSVRIGTTTIALLCLVAFSASGQTGGHALEVRGGAAVPASGFAELVGVGPAFGLGYQFRPKGGVLVMIDADYSSQPVTDDDTAIKVYHLLGKFGLDLVGKPNPISFILNLGAGVMIFDFETVPNKTYFGTNAGAKLGYGVGQATTLYLNIQADVAFSASSGLVQTGNAWIVPVTAGLAYRY
jgi:hypothetical protein